MIKISFQSYFSKTLFSLFIFSLLFSFSGFCDSNRLSSNQQPVYLWTSFHVTSAGLGRIKNGEHKLCKHDSSKLPNKLQNLNHRAILAHGTSDPRKIIDPKRPVFRPDNTLIVENYAAFFDKNVTLTNPVTIKNVTYWTGIDSSGSPSANNCHNWTSAAKNVDANIGHGNRKDILRFYGPIKNDCAALFPILCVSY